MKRKALWILVLMAGVIAFGILYSLYQGGAGGKVGERHVSRGRLSKKNNSIGHDHKV